MRIYFLSSQPCALKLGGVYFGAVDTFERFANVTLSDNILVEFIPENALPIAFFLTESLRETPPEGCEVYILREGIAVYARDFTPNDFTLRPIAQITQDDCRATVFSQGKIHLSVQTATDFFIATLPPSFLKTELFFHKDFLFLKSPQELAIYTKTGKQVFLEKVLSYSVQEDELSVKIPLLESLGRAADCVYSLTEQSCTQTRCTLTQTRKNPSAETSDIQEELLPYAFFESILLGADVAELLSEDLKASAKDLPAFFGEFVSVFPTKDWACCALIKKRKENLFEAVYYTITLKNGKISDITT